MNLIPDNYLVKLLGEPATNAVTNWLILSGGGAEGSFGTTDAQEAVTTPEHATTTPLPVWTMVLVITLAWVALMMQQPISTQMPRLIRGCLYCDPGTFILTVDMSDSGGDGWNGAQYGIFNDGGTVYQGSLDSAFTGDLATGRDVLCLSPGCYTFQVTASDFPDEISVSLSDEFGTEYGTIGAPATYGIDFTLTGQCSFRDCTNPQANNFNPSASIDDGSCQNPPANDLIENAEAIACGLSVAGTVQYSNDEGAAGLAFGQFQTGGTDHWYVNQL